jgi:hypothetical protein
MRREPGLHEKIDTVGTDAWLRTLGLEKGFDFDSSVDRYLYPKRALHTRMVDEELAELASRAPSALTELARSELRSREGWRTPAKWSLFVALAALVVSAAALIRTF